MTLFRSVFSTITLMGLVAVTLAIAASPAGAQAPAAECLATLVPGGTQIDLSVDPAPSRVHLREYRDAPNSKWLQAIDRADQGEPIFLDGVEPKGNRFFLRYRAAGEVFETPCWDVVNAPQFVDGVTPLICTETLLDDGSARVDFLDFAPLGLTSSQLASTRFFLRTTNFANGRATAWVATFNGAPTGSFVDDSNFGLNLDGKRDAFVRYRIDDQLFDVACRFEGAEAAA